MNNEYEDGKDFHGFKVMGKDEIDKGRYKKQAGVWAMFGKKDERYKCLNVGKNKSVGDELKIDYKRLENQNEAIKINQDGECQLYSDKLGRGEYRNQFNEEEFKFEYPLCPDRQDFLYRRIAEEYRNNILTILVAGESNYMIEKYFAYSTKAAYWVSNGRYKPETRVNEEKINEILQGIEIEKTLRDKIKDFKNWYDNQ